MAHAKKPPPGDTELFIVCAIALGVLTSVYVLLHNWVGLLVYLYRCGPEC